MTVTWFRLPELGAENANTIQLVLRADGTIDMSFEDLSPTCGPSIEQQYNYAAASTTGGDPAPGGRPRRISTPADGNPSGRHVRPSGADQFHARSPVVRHPPGGDLRVARGGFRGLPERADRGARRAHSRGEPPRALPHPPAAAGEPLHSLCGCCPVECARWRQGTWTASVRVQSRDEIGSLARSFNRMVESIGRAESSFRALAEDAQDGIIVFSDDIAVYANRRAAEMTGYTDCGLYAINASACFSGPPQLPPYGVQPETPAEVMATTASGEELPVELVYSRTLWHGRPAIAVAHPGHHAEETGRGEGPAAAAELDAHGQAHVPGRARRGPGPRDQRSQPGDPFQRVPAVQGFDRSLPYCWRPPAQAPRGFSSPGWTTAEFRGRWPEMLSAIVKSSTLIDGIIRNLREFSADTPSRGAALFDINTAIRNAVDLLAAYIRRATDRFSVELQPDLPRTRGSAQGLQQVFINLILNSCQSLGGRDRAITVCSRPGDSTADAAGHRP